MLLLGVQACAQAGRPLARDKTVLALWAAAATANALDIRSTEAALAGGEHELDPLMKPIMRLPVPAAYAEQQATVAVLGILAHRMRYSRRKLLRKAFWLPLAALTVANLCGYVHNRRPSSGLRRP